MGAIWYKEWHVMLAFSEKILVRDTVTESTVQR